MSRTDYLAERFNRTGLGVEELLELVEGLLEERALWKNRVLGEYGVKVDA